MAAASEKQASDIVLLDLRSLCSFADYFVILSGESERQLEAIRDEIDKTLEEDGQRLLHQEGDPASGWLLLDYGEVIVHIFTSPQREYYQLDRLWAQATPLVRIQ